MVVAPPRGERGLKLLRPLLPLSSLPVAPPRGERGLKPRVGGAKADGNRRSPSWGAWIETHIGETASTGSYVAPPRGERGLKHDWAVKEYGLEGVAPPRGERGLKRGGATPPGTRLCVAPPRGERGLKPSPFRPYTHPQDRRSPSWGAWIETLSMI